MTSTMLVIAAIAALGTVGIVMAIGMSQAYAQNNGNSACSDRGLSAGCSPGQHVNENSGTVVGNPHYTCSTCGGGPATGDPHNGAVQQAQGDTSGNPHYKVP